MPGSYLNLFYQFLHLNSFTVENTVISRIPNHPNNRMPNKPHTSPKLLRPNFPSPTNSMNKQVRTGDKIKIQPLHYLPPHYRSKIAM